jgi:16S rRNA (guanine527-N7)-methyltransferase
LAELPAYASSRRLLLEALTSLQISVGPRQVEALFVLARLLETWSRRMNLTGHRSLDAIVRRLVVEAAALAEAMPQVPSLADLGSGAGFPGLPIAVLRPDCQLTLVEARMRRHHFQRAAVRELRLRNTRLELGRAEQIEARPHAAVIAQAVARPERALQWMLRWAEPEGFLLLPGSELSPEVPEMPGVSFQECVRYRVPCGGPLRTLWVGRRKAG